jgi:uncharacterized membrane protein YidH (DUF202 family)
VTTPVPRPPDEPGPPDEAGPPESEPPGLAVERTQLAWRRTFLATTVAYLVVVSHALVDGARPVPVAAAALCTGSWLAMFGLSQRRVRRLSHDPRRPVRRSPTVVAVLILGYAALGALVVLG